MAIKSRPPKRKPGTVTISYKPRFEYSLETDVLHMRGTIGFDDGQVWTNKGSEEELYRSVAYGDLPLNIQLAIDTLTTYIIDVLDTEFDLR